MEPDFTTVEEAVFDNMDTRQQDNNFDHTDEPPATGNVYQYSSYPTGGAETTVGPAMILKVGKGDNVDMTVYGKFKDLGTYSTATVAGFIGELANSLDQVSLVIETANEATSVINGAFAAIGSYGGISDQEPRAYLNYILFDDDFGYVTSGFDRIDATAGYIADPNEVGFDQLGFNVPIDDNGYIYVWLSNETAASEVWFDDLLVEHSKSPIIQTDDYYPFGLAFNSYQRTGALPNLFKYNGFEYQEDLGLNLYDYQARQYDPALGRFTSIDPAADLMRRFSPYSYAFDNPIRFIDPDGMMPSDAVDPYSAVAALNEWRNSGNEDEDKDSENDNNDSSENDQTSDVYNKPVNAIHNLDNVYKEGNQRETYQGIRGLPHLAVAQGAFVVNANFGIYKGADGKYFLKFSGTVKHFAQALGESMFTAETKLLVDGEFVGSAQLAQFSPGESAIINPNELALGNTITSLPAKGRTIQIQLIIKSYFKDGQHPGVDFSKSSWKYNVPFVVGGPKLGPK